VQGFTPKFTIPFTGVLPVTKEFTQKTGALVTDVKRTGLELDADTKEAMQAWYDAIVKERADVSKQPYKSNLRLIHVKANRIGYKASVRRSTFRDLGYTKRQLRRVRHTFPVHKFTSVYPVEIHVPEMQGSFDAKLSLRVTFRYDKHIVGRDTHKAGDVEITSTEAKV
jgi:hypothetical protein